jgi:acyl CoA:acetate/3-ketoacid CoA transferase beta subunit
MLLKDVCVIDTGMPSLVTHAVEGHRCAARARDGILGHGSLDLGQQLDSR